MLVEDALEKRLSDAADRTLLREAIDGRLAALEFDAPPFGPKEWVRDRAALLIRTVTVPVRLAITPGRPAKSRVIGLDTGADNPRVRDYRLYFLKHFYEIDADLIGGRDAFLACHNPDVSAALRFWAWTLWLAVLSLVDFSPRRYRWLVDAWVSIIGALLMRRCVDRVFVFQLSYPAPYVSASFLSYRAGMDVTLVMPNVPMYMNNRYCHLRLPTVLCSKVQVYEHEYFRRAGTIVGPAAEYAGSEYVLDFADVPFQAPTVDIGVFSSGEWARVQGVVQTLDFEAVRRGECEGSMCDRRAREILAALVDFAERNGRTLRIYLHPYERMLLRDHGIRPPWWSVADGVRVTIDAEEANSRHKVYEARVGVSLQSSFIWERLDLGMDDSFIYDFAEPQFKTFLVDSLGPYARCAFGSTEELLDKVSGVLGPGADVE